MSDMWVGGGDRKLVGIDSQGVHFFWPDFFCSFTNSQGVHFFGPPKLYPHPDSIPTSLLKSPRATCRRHPEAENEGAAGTLEEQKE